MKNYFSFEPNAFSHEIATSVIFSLLWLCLSSTSIAQIVDCSGTPIELVSCETPVQNPTQHFVCIDAVTL